MSENNSILENISDSIGDLVSGVPAPIRKNFFKAFSRLCTAAVDVPVSILESKANEIRAASEARVEIIKTEGEIISQKVDVPIEYIENASKKFAARIIREQLNLDKIAAKTAMELSNDKFREEGGQEISDDWLNEFESFAKLKSSEDMQIAFSKILSGEIKKPGKYSIRTLRIISQLDNEAANIFQKFCSISVGLKYKDTPAQSLMAVTMDNGTSSNLLRKYGMPYSSLLVLQEYGLIVNYSGSISPFDICIRKHDNTVGAALHFEKKDYGLIPVDGALINELNFTGILLSKAGNELFEIIPIVPNKQYREDFLGYINDKGLKMVEIKNNR